MKKKNPNTALLLLSAMTFLTNGDIYLSAPLLLSIGNDLNISVSSAALTVTSYMGAFAFFNLFFGPAGDRFGRTKIIILCSFGTSVFSCLSFYVDSLSTLIIFRAFNGGFAAGIMPVSVAIIGEAFDEDKRQKAIASMIGIMILGGASASIIGGGLSYILSWKSVYLAYGLGELVISFMLLFFLESRPGSGKKLNVFRMYTEVLKNRMALYCLCLVGLSGLIVAGSFSFTGELIRGATGMNVFEIGVVLSCFGIGGIVSSRITKYTDRFPMATICISAGVIGGFSIYCIAGTTSAPVFAVGLFLWGITFVTIHSSNIAVAQNLIPELRGTIMSMMSFSRLAGGTIGTLINKRVMDSYQINSIFIYTAVLFSIFAVFAAVILHTENKPKDKDAPVLEPSS